MLLEFNVNKSVVNMLQLLAENHSLQVFLIAFVIAARLPDIIRALRDMPRNEANDDDT